MDNNFKFKTRHVSFVQRSSSVVNSFVSSVELIQAMTYKSKRDTNQNFEKLMYNFKMGETWNNTCASSMSLVRTLVDRVSKINNSWLGFHKDIKDLTLILVKNLFPVRMVEKVINRYVSRATIRPSASSQVQQASSTYYFKLPYVGSFTREAQKRLRKLVQRYCTNIEIKLAFSSFKVAFPLWIMHPTDYNLCWRRQCPSNGRTPL